SVAGVRQQRVTELAVGGRRVELHLRSAAEVDFERVVTPGGELVGILLVVPVASLPSPAAAVTARIGIDPREQALGVDIVGDGLHAPRPSGGVDRDVAGGVPRTAPPSAVDPDISITGGPEPPAHDGVRHRRNGGLIET